MNRIFTYFKWKYSTQGTLDREVNYVETFKEINKYAQSFEYEIHSFQALEDGIIVVFEKEES